MKLKSLFALSLVLLIGLFFYFGGAEVLSFQSVQSHLEEFRAAFKDTPVVTGLWYFSIYVLVTALSIPGAAPLTLLGGAVFGLWWGVVIVSFASSLGATLAFLMARYFLYDWVKVKFKSHHIRLQKEFDQNGTFLVLSVRLVPFIPFFVANLVFGLMPIKTRNFYLASQLGMLPGTIVFVNAGQQLGELKSFDGILSIELWLAFLALALIPWMMRLVLPKKFKIRKFDYQTVVIGGGSAGLVASSLTAGLKGHVALIEKHHMGGDCLYTGCVPSKSLIRSARLAHQMRTATELGFKNTQFEVDFEAVMKRVHSVIKSIEPHDSPKRYESLGVKCIKGEAQILSANEVLVNGQTLRTKNIIVATGAGPNIPNFPGISDVQVLHSGNLWSLTKLPKKLLVVGGGPIGCELAQSFLRLGSQVTLVESENRLLSKEEPEVSDLMLKTFQKEGMDIHLKSRVLRFEKHLEQSICVIEKQDNIHQLDFDAVLLALGRKPHSKGFGLEELGIELHPDGKIKVDSYLRTNVSGIYACGDVAGPYQFTHAAGHQGSVAALNAYFRPLKKFKWNNQEMPWVTYTDPEIAHLGLTEEQAHKNQLEFEVTHFDLKRSDRALTEGASDGFIKVITRKGKDKILGVTVVSENAGDLLAEFSVTLKAGKGLNHILSVIHAYPTLVEANKSLALQWRKDHQPKLLLRILKRLNDWRLRM